MQSSTHITVREPNLAELVQAIWDGRGVVILSVLAGLFLGGVLIFLSVPQSRAQMVIAPAAPMEDNGGVPTIQQGDDRRSPPTQAGMNFDRFQSVAKGAALATALLRSPDVIRGLEADRAFSISASEADWSAELLAEYIARRVQFMPVGESALRTLRYSHPDPKFATEFLTRIHGLADGLIRQSIRKETQERIAYLQQELQSAVNPDHRRSLADLLLEQERLRMLVSIDQPYAAVVVEPAFSSAKPVWPDFSLILISFGAAGAFLGMFICALQHGPIVSDVSQQPQEARERLRAMRGWSKQTGGNANQNPSAQSPLRGKSKKSPPSFNSDAAE